MDKIHNSLLEKVLRYVKKSLELKIVCPIFCFWIWLPLVYIFVSALENIINLV